MLKLSSMPRAMALFSCIFVLACDDAAHKSVTNDPTSPASSVQSALTAVNDSLVTADAAAANALQAPASSTAAEGLAEGDACASVIGAPNPASGGEFDLTWLYAECEQGEKGKVSGMRSIHVKRDGAATQQTVTQNLVRQLGSGPHVISQGAHTVLTQGLAGSTPVTHTVQTHGGHFFSKVGAALGGKVGDGRKYNQKFEHTLTAVDSYQKNSGSEQYVLTQRVVSGSGHLDHGPGETTTQITFRDVTYQMGLCAWPVSGTLQTATSYNGGKPENESYTWGRPCGTATTSAGESASFAETH